MIQLTVELPEDVVQQAVVDSWRAAFRKPRYDGDPGEYAYEEVRRQVAKFVRSEIADTIAGLIAEQARLQLHDVVATVVADELRKAAKAQAKRMATDGTLFEAQAQ